MSNGQKGSDCLCPSHDTAAARRERRRTSMRQPEGERSPGLFDGITCQQVVALLLDYIAGALEIETALTLQKHLRDCQECVAFLHTYQATIRATRALRDADVPPAMQYRVLSFLHATLQRQPPER